MLIDQNCERGFMEKLHDERHLGNHLPDKIIEDAIPEDSKDMHVLPEHLECLLTGLVCVCST